MTKRVKTIDGRMRYYDYSNRHADGHSGVLFEMAVQQDQKRGCAGTQPVSTTTGDPIFSGYVCG